MLLYYQWQNAVGRWCFSLSEEPQQSCSGKNDVKPGWPVRPHADSLHQFLQKLIKILQQVIMKCVKLVGLALILCIHLFHRPGAGVCGPGTISALVQLGWSISGTKTRPDLQYRVSFKGRGSHQDPSANEGAGLQLLSHAHFT